MTNVVIIVNLRLLSGAPLHQELYDLRIFVKFVLDLINILQELDDHGIIVKIFIDFDQNSFKPALLAKKSDYYRILQELYDHRILVKFVLDLIRILQEIL